MTKKELRDNLKETIKSKICEMINCKELDTKTISNAHLKHIKCWLSSKCYPLESYLFCLNYISEQYYSWEVELRDINPIDNCGRLIYLVNENIDICHSLLNKESIYIETQDDVKLTSVKDIEDYNSIAKKVGL